MEAKMRNLEKIGSVKDKLVEFLETEVAEGKACVADAENLMIMGAVTDMVKDLAEAEEKCAKAIEAQECLKEMAEERKLYETMGLEGYMPPMGYHRSGSTGRFVRGYTPAYPMMEPHMGGERGMGWEGGVEGLTDRNFRGGFAVEPYGEQNPDGAEGRGRMGYQGGGSNGGGQGGNGRSGYNGGSGGGQGGSGGNRGGSSRGGSASTGYSGTSGQGRYGYTREEGIENTVKSLEQMWEGADQQVKERLRSDIEKMLQE